MEKKYAYLRELNYSELVNTNGGENRSFVANVFYNFHVFCNRTFDWLGEHPVDYTGYSGT